MCVWFLNFLQCGSCCVSFVHLDFNEEYPVITLSDELQNLVNNFRA